MVHYLNLFEHSTLWGYNSFSIFQLLKFSVNLRYIPFVQESLIYFCGRAQMFFRSSFNLSKWQDILSILRNKPPTITSKRYFIKQKVNEVTRPLRGFILKMLRIGILPLTYVIICQTGRAFNFNHFRYDNVVKDDTSCYYFTI